MEKELENTVEKIKHEKVVFYIFVFGTEKRSANIYIFYP